MAQGRDKEKDKQKNKQRDKEEINRLFREYASTKDIRIRNRLIEQHLYIAEILAKKYINKGIEYDDLFQVASIGLILAVDRFNIEKGFEFSSYATPTIIGEIKKYFRDKGWVIRVPRRIQEMSKKVNTARTTLSQDLQRAPTVGEIADYLETTEEEVLEVIEASKVYSPQSLDAQLDSANEDKDVRISDLIGEEDSYFEKIEIIDFIEKGMQSLNDMEKLILRYRYFDKKTQVAIAKELNISQMTVSRIEKKIMEKFRRELELTESGPKEE